MLSGILISSTSSVIATEKMPSASPSMRCLDRPGMGLVGRAVIWSRASSVAERDGARAETRCDGAGSDRGSFELELENRERSAAAAIRDDAIALDEEGW